MNEDFFKKKIAENIRRLRKSLGYTQEQLGKLVGVKRTTIASIEANIGGKSKKTNLFPILKLPKYLKALQCTTEELFSPLFDKSSENKELLDLINKIKRIYKIPEAKRKLQDDIDTIEKAFNLK